MNYSHKKTIYLFTETFPYGTGETFLNTEIIYLSKYFKKIYIIPSKKTILVRDMPTNVEILDFYINKRVSKIKRIIYTIFSNYFYDAFIKDFPKSMSISYLKLNFVWAYNTALMCNVIEEITVKHNIKFDHCVFYTYFFSSATNALAILKAKVYHKLFFISRVHGWDLYEERANILTFPYRQFTLEQINKVYSISNDGVEHIQNLYNYKNVELSRLGVLSHGKKRIRITKDYLHIVSCSHIIPLKRLFLIANIIDALGDKKVKWTHFGQGIDKKLDSAISRLSAKKNIEINFIGQQPNEFVLNYYASNEIDFFINVSVSEGVPVSIMEAMSASIPVIATNVGGTSEIVRNDYNGFLLDKNFIIKDALHKIDALITKQQILSKNAYITWEEVYNADKNYKSFCESI